MAELTLVKSNKPSQGRPENVIPIDRAKGVEKEHRGPTPS